VGGINWAQVRRYARIGGDRERIVKAMGITPEQLRDVVILTRLQEELERGGAQHDLDLLTHAERLRRGGDGSVNAVLAAMRHRLGYNSPDSNKSRADAAPDLEAGVAELQRILARVR